MTARVFTQRKSDHDPGPGHPERPDRIEACTKVLEGFEGITVSEGASATMEQLSRAHDNGFLEQLEKFCTEGGGWIDQDTFAGPGSFETSVAASGASCESVAAVMDGGEPSFSLVRPPGHHAGPRYAMGFCLLNHAAVGAHHALALGAERVYIVDFDVHHGNGTQDIFWEHPGVLYLSMHQYPWYPGTGALEETGAGAGSGTTVNIPLRAGGGDELYMAVMERVVAPVGRIFRPDLIMVSAGFDAHSSDPLSLMELSADGFGALVSSLKELADEVCRGRIVMTLEGGYDLDALSDSFAAALGALSGRRAAMPPEKESEEIDRIVAFHRRLWEIA